MIYADSTGDFSYGDRSLINQLNTFEGPSAFETRALWSLVVFSARVFPIQPAPPKRPTRVDAPARHANDGAMAYGLRRSTGSRVPS
jgi:hypothetical protein